MKRLIYKPAIGEIIPNDSMAYALPTSGDVVDAIVPDDFSTSGIILYDSLNGIDLPEPHIHHFAGWEV